MAKQPGMISPFLAELFHQHGRRCHFKSGKQVFMKNDIAEEIYYLEKGTIRAYLLYPDGSERTLCYIESGNLAGEEVVATPPRRTVCADAATDITLISLRGSVLLEYCQAQPTVLKELLAMYMQKIELLSNWIFYGQFSRNEARVACFLYDHSEFSNQIFYTQEQIASVTGVSRVSISQLLSRFSSLGLVERKYGYLIVLEREKLRDYFIDQTF